MSKKKSLLDKMRQAAIDILSDPEEAEKRKARKAAMQTNFNLYKGSHMSQENQGIQIRDYINGWVTYDREGQYFWINSPGPAGMKMLGELRGWGAIQNMQAFKDTEGNIDTKQAGIFQDEIGKWVADAINEKLQREIDRQKREISKDKHGSVSVEIIDMDIATVEALHDLLLDNHGYSLDFVTLVRARELTAKMYEAFKKIGR